MWKPETTTAVALKMGTGDKTNGVLPCDSNGKLPKEKESLIAEKQALDKLPKTGFKPG